MPTRSAPAESRRGNPGRWGRDQYTFDQFVAAEENRLPLAAARAIASGEVVDFTSLYLVGPRGSGKTHLLRAAADESSRTAATRRHNTVKLKDHNRGDHQPARSGDVIAVSGKRFVSELADAIDTRSTDEFQSRYHSVRLLLVDDVDTLAGKSWAQEELVGTMEAVGQAGGLAMFTSRRWPAETALEPRLVSRLSDAVVLALEHPGLAARLQLIRRLTQGKSARGKTVAWTTAAINTAARQLQGGAEDIRRAVADISRRAEEGDAVVDEAAITAIASSAGTTPPLASIVRQTARWFQLTADDLRGSSRRRSVATARAVAMYLARELTGKSFQQIGAYFSDRDHTTVMHSCRRATELIDSQAEVRMAASQLRSDLAANPK
jgi:chromosomal replication initiator protein